NVWTARINSVWIAHNKFPVQVHGDADRPNQSATFRQDPLSAAFGTDMDHSTDAKVSVSRSYISDIKVIAVHGNGLRVLEKPGLNDNSLGAALGIDADYLSWRCRIDHEKLPIICQC